MKPVIPLEDIRDLDIIPKRKHTDYKTKFVWSKNKKHMYIFYYYKSSIGCVPTDINYKYHNKLYSTIDVMKELAKGEFEYHSRKYVPSDWYDLENNVFNKTEFIELIKRFKRST